MVICLISVIFVFLKKKSLEVTFGMDNPVFWPYNLSIVARKSTHTLAFIHKDGLYFSIRS